MLNRRNVIQGLTLVELLISLTISLFILGAVFEIFFTVQKNHLAINAMTEMQENTHIAFELLSADIRIAGYSDYPNNRLFKRIDAQSDSILVRYVNNNEVKSKKFYIHDTKRFDQQGHRIKALYSNKTELVEGIDRIRFLYSVISNGEIIEKNANELKNEKIIGVAIELLLHSLNNFPLQKKAYTYVALREE
jgi:type II secretory pathway component PulJ